MVGILQDILQMTSSNAFQWIKDRDFKQNIIQLFY